MNGLKTAFTIRAPNASGSLSVERDESALVWRAMDERLPVEHRKNCAPQAILQCRLVTAPHAAVPGKSPGQASTSSSRGDDEQMNCGRRQEHQPQI
jgi:hypothetical protein